MAAPSGLVLLPRLDTGGFPEAATLHHGLASWDVASTYTFIVPAGVTRLLIDLQGAWALGGTDSVDASGWAPMAGARVLHWADVPPGVSLTIVIGAAGNQQNSGADSTVTGGGMTLVAGGGNPAHVNTGATGGAQASARPTSGGNVLSQGSGGNGACVIQW